MIAAFASDALTRGGGTRYNAPDLRTDFVGNGRAVDIAGAGRGAF